MNLVLASSSPRRRDLVARLGVAHTVQPSNVAERRPAPGEDPAAYAESLAREKAAAVAALRPGSIVIGADTVVAAGGEIFGKPADATDALRMLRKLRGRRHVVVTGVAVVCGGQTVTESLSATVVMRDTSDDELRAYIATGEPMDKAGAYAVQGTGGALVAEVLGCYSTVVGLPLRLVANLLSSHCGLRIANPDCCPYCAGV